MGELTSLTIIKLIQSFSAELIIIIQYFLFLTVNIMLINI